MTARVRRLATAAVTGVALALSHAPAAAASALPRDSSDVLLIGDSVTSGVYFLSLTDASIRQAWSGQLLDRLGIAQDPGRFPEPYPINHLGVARLGSTVAGFAYAWEARPGLGRTRSKYEAGDERTVLAVPGQTVREVLRQSSLNRGYRSSGWTFAKQLLPEGLSAMETVEQWTKRPRWVVLFIGANDLLAYFGMTGRWSPPSPAVFEADYDELVRRLRARMPADAASAQLLVLTLPDATRLPFLQPLPEGADNGRGNAYPAGSVTSAFLAPFRTHFAADEVWTPSELDSARALARAYNEAIRTVARRHGLTVVDIGALLDELDADPRFGAPDSPYFSPDLHHPSHRTHRAIMEDVLAAMVRVAGAEAPPAVESDETPLPHAGDFAGRQQAYVNAMMHLAVQTLGEGPLPPRPSYRLALEAGAQAGDARVGDATLSAMAGIESPASPITRRWLARATVQGRATVLAWDDDVRDVNDVLEESAELRAGVAAEPTAAWHWMRIEPGFVAALEGGVGWYLRAEWRFLYADVSSRGWEPERFEAGVQVDVYLRRAGRNGN